MEIAWWILLFGAASVCTAYALKYGRNLLRVFYLSREIPGPSLWELGREHLKARRLGEDVLTASTRLCASYGHKPWGLWTRHGYLLILSDYASVSEVYKSKHFSDRSGLLVNIVPRYIGKGTMSLNGPEHKLHRKITGSLFRRPLLESKVPSCDQAAVGLVTMLKESYGSGEEVDARFLVAKQVFEVMISISTADFVSAQRLAVLRDTFHIIQAIGVDIQLETVNPLYYWLVHKRTKAHRKLRSELATFLAMYDAIYRETYDHVMQEIDRSVDMASGYLFEAMIRESLRSKIENPFELLLTETKHILVAGLETISVALNLSLLLLALHPDVQQKVFQETDSIFGSDDRPVQLEDLSKMVYLEMFIKETVRLFPPVPATDRVCTEEAVINGVRVPKGTKVILHFMALHRDPSVFKDPLKFDPDRFSSESLPNGFIPFGSGAKACVGQELAKLTMTTFLSQVVRNFKILPGKNLRCVDDIKIDMQFGLHLCESSLRFEDRHRSEYFA